MIVLLRPNLSIVRPPIRDPNTAPPEKVLLMAPMMELPVLVSKYSRKFSLAITSVITPLS
jgi:hypothetical protein